MMQGLLMALNPMLLVNKLLSIAKTGITAFKNYFGIKSPSRLFMAMGAHMTNGLALGIDGGGGRPLASMRRLAGRIAGGAAAGAVAATPAAAATPGAAGASYHYEFHIHAGPGQNAKDIAEEVRKVMEDLDRERRAQARASFRDDEDA